MGWMERMALMRGGGVGRPERVGKQRLEIGAGEEWEEGGSEPVRCENEGGARRNRGGWWIRRGRRGRGRGREGGAKECRCGDDTLRSRWREWWRWRRERDEVGQGELGEEVSVEDLKEKEQTEKVIQTLQEDLETRVFEVERLTETLSASEETNAELAAELEVVKQQVRNIQDQLDAAKGQLQKSQESRKRKRGLFDAQLFGEQVTREELDRQNNYSDVARYRRLLFERLEDLGKAVEAFNRIVMANYQKPSVRNALDNFNKALEIYFETSDDGPLVDAERELKRLENTKNIDNPTNQLIIKRINIIKTACHL